MSELKVNKISPRSGTDITLGDSGDAISVASGASLTSPGLTLSDNILFNTASKGIYLGVTSATASNLLDDYEEGTWTPIINSGTYTLITAKYTKIGNLCYLSFRVANFSDTSSATNILITGMPFAQPSNTEEGVGSAYGERTDVNKPTVCMNSNTISFRDGFGVSTFSTPLQYSDINDGADFDIIASVTYETA
jgi:hypothetical protein